MLESCSPVRQAYWEDLHISHGSVSAQKLNAFLLHQSALLGQISAFYSVISEITQNKRHSINTNLCSCISLQVACLWEEQHGTSPMPCFFTWPHSRKCYAPEQQTQLLFYLAAQRCTQGWSSACCAVGKMHGCIKLSLFIALFSVEQYSLCHIGPRFLPSHHCWQR